MPNRKCPTLRLRFGFYDDHSTRLYELYTLILT